MIQKTLKPLNFIEVEKAIVFVSTKVGTVNFFISHYLIVQQLIISILLLFPILLEEEATSWVVSFDILSDLVTYVVARLFLFDFSHLDATLDVVLEVKHSFHSWNFFHGNPFASFISLEDNSSILNSDLEHFTLILESFFIDYFIRELV